MCVIRVYGRGYGYQILILPVDMENIVETMFVLPIQCFVVLAVGMLEALRSKCILKWEKTCLVTQNSISDPANYK